MKILTAQQKAKELGISLSGLRQSRHLYKHIKKSPRKYLYFEEEYRPSMHEPPVTVPRSRSRRRNVPFGDTNYSKAPSGSGEHFKLLNQMRSKMALEASIPKEEQEAFTDALAHKVKENYNEINEQRKEKIRSELLQEDERLRKKDPRRYAHFNPRGRLVNLRTKWNEIFPREKTEYDLAEEDLESSYHGPKYY